MHSIAGDMLGYYAAVHIPYHYRKDSYEGIQSRHLFMIKVFKIKRRIHDRTMWGMEITPLVNCGPWPESYAGPHNELCIFHPKMYLLFISL